MSLRQIMRECPDRLDADLMRVYGIPLADVEAGLYPLRSVAAWVEHLPRGSAVAAYYGGEKAVTAETEQLMIIEWVQRSINSPKKLKPPEYPTGVRATEQKITSATMRAEQFRQRAAARKNNTA